MPSKQTQDQKSALQVAGAEDQAGSARVSPTQQSRQDEADSPEDAR